MDKMRAAAIIILGLGDKYSSNILTNIPPKDVEHLIDAINNVGEITEVDIIEALNEFFKDANGGSGIDIVAKESLMNSLSTMIESKRIEGAGDGSHSDRIKWIDIFKVQPNDRIMAIIEEEHPQIIAVIISHILSGDKASRIFKMLPQEIQSQVIKRMAFLSTVSSLGMDCLSKVIENELQTKETISEISVDGVDAIANIISYLDSETEKHILEEISNTSAELSERIQEKIVPFERLATLDKKSLQTLISEINNDDLVIALKGVDAFVKEAFFSNMSSKSAEILRDEIEAKGPIKISHVVEAQKKIITLAKKLAAEEKIVLSLKIDADVVY